MEEAQAIRRAEKGFAGAVGVRHHAEDVAAFTEDARDVFEGAVGVGLRCDLSGGGAVAESDAVPAFELVQGVGVAKVVAFHVADRHLENLPFLEGVGKGGVGAFSAEVNLFANVAEASVAHECAGKEASFAKDLEAVADADDGAALPGESLDALHDGGEACEGASAKVIAVGEAAGDEDGVAVLEVGGAVPKEGDGLVQVRLNHMVGVVVAV